MDANTPPLFPEHLTDLLKSGLSRQMIDQMGVRSLTPDQFLEFEGKRFSGVTSFLAIPYPGVEGFVRYKLFPPWKDENGKEQKYFQRKNSGTPLYVLSPVRELLKNSDVPLYITEGEKKSAALTQIGKPCIGLGGPFNWIIRETHLPIQEIENISWKDRLVYLVPDSDAWLKDQVLDGFFRLGKELEHRGAIIRVVKIPEMAGHEKIGADDFLVLRGSKAFQRLCDKSVSLSHAAFRSFQLKEKRIEANAKNAKPLPEELTGRRIHPAIHFESDWASIGIIRPTKDGLGSFLVTSDRKMYATAEIPSAFLQEPKIYRDLSSRWPEECLQKYLGGSPTGTLGNLAAILIERIRSILDLKRLEEVAVIATWVIGTYWSQLFDAFPRLNLVGEKGSGKSKLLMFLSMVCLNGIHRLSPTPAVLFRLATLWKPTFCLDEMEGLSSDDRGEILSIINAGYKRGAAIDRVEGEDRRIESYQVFTPMSLAGIKELNPVTEDRAIVLVMQRSQNPEKLNAVLKIDDPIGGKIRALGYELALTRFRDISSVYERVNVPEWLEGRERELWSPLLAVAQLIDQETELGLEEDLLQIAKSQSGERTDFSPESEALIGILESRLGFKPKEDGTTPPTVADFEHSDCEFFPSDLCEEMEKALNLNRKITPQAIAGALRRLGLAKVKRGRLGDSTGTIYRATPDWVLQVRARYTPRLPATLQQQNTCNNGTNDGSNGYGVV